MKTIYKLFNYYRSLGYSTPAAWREARKRGRRLK